MTTQFSTDFTPAPQKPKRKVPWLAVIIATVALIIGAGAGHASGSSKIPDTVEVEKEVEVKVPATPAVCSEALSLAEDVISSASRALGYSLDSMDAVADLDADRIRANGSKTEAETAVLEELGPKFRNARDTCLSTVS
jgi:hypothetical protein